MSPELATAGYSGTPLAQKLGYKDGQCVLFLALPASLDELRSARAFASVVTGTWDDVAKGGDDLDVIHGFTRSRAELATAARALRRQVARDGMVWVSWPKQASKIATDVNEHTIRELLLPTGLVDVKVAAIDQMWSGLKLVIRKELR